MFDSDFYQILTPLSPVASPQRPSSTFFAPTPPVQVEQQVSLDTIEPTIQQVYQGKSHRHTFTHFHSTTVTCLNIRLFDLNNQNNERRNFLQNMRLLVWKLPPIKSHILSYDCRHYDKHFYMLSSPDFCQMTSFKLFYMFFFSNSATSKSQK